MRQPSSAASRGGWITLTQPEGRSTNAASARPRCRVISGQRGVSGGQRGDRGEPRCWPVSRSFTLVQWKSPDWLWFKSCSRSHAVCNPNERDEKSCCPIMQHCTVVALLHLQAGSEYSREGRSFSPFCFSPDCVFAVESTWFHLASLQRLMFAMGPKFQSLI